MNRITLGWRAETLGGGDRGRSHEELADARVEVAGEEDITLGESATATTTAMVTITATSIEPAVETGAPAAANVWSEPAQLRLVLRMNHGRARDGSRTGGGCGMSAGTTEGERRSRNGSSGVRYPKMKDNVDGVA